MTKAHFLLRFLDPPVICTEAPALLACFLGPCGCCAESPLSASFQVWLCHHAEIAQQSHGGEAVGAALDQELLVWGAVEEDASQLFLRARSVGHGENEGCRVDGRGASSPDGVWDQGAAALLSSRKAPSWCCLPGSAKGLSGSAARFFLH